MQDSVFLEISLIFFASIIDTNFGPQSWIGPWTGRTASHAWRTARHNSGTKKAVKSRVMWGVIMSWAYTEFWIKRPGKHTIAENPDVALAVEGSTQHYQFTPLSMEDDTHNMTEGYRPWVGCVHLSIPLPACGAHEHDHHCETVWIQTRHWRHSASDAWGPTFYAFSCACDPEPIRDTRWDVITDS